MRSRRTRLAQSGLFVNQFCGREKMNIGKLRDTDALAILSEGSLGRLGCIAAGWPYVVPVNYFFDGKDIYIHTLPGKKIDALRANARVCLQWERSARFLVCYPTVRNSRSRRRSNKS